MRPAAGAGMAMSTQAGWKVETRPPARGAEHGDEDGDAEHGADLARGRREGAAGGEARGRQLGHRGAAPGREAQADARPGQELAGRNSLA